MEIERKKNTPITRVKRHKRKHTAEKPFKCDHCHKTFAQKNILKTHLIAHIGDNFKPFKCDTCHMKFKSKVSLKSHLHVHPGEKFTECKICNQTFTNQNYLKHAHTGESPFKCKICNKTYVRLKLHLLIHSGEKAFECDVCYKKFLRLGDLKRHVLQHTGEKPFECHLCDKKYTRKTQLTTHLLIHTDTGDSSVFKCQICNKTFKTNAILKGHSKSCDKPNDLNVIWIKQEIDLEDTNKGKEQRDVKLELHEEVDVKSEKEQLSEEEDSFQ